MFFLALYLWFSQGRSKGDPISGPLLCEKALGGKVKVVTIKVKLRHFALILLFLQAPPSLHVMIFNIRIVSGFIYCKDRIRLSEYCSVLIDSDKLCSTVINEKSYFPPARAYDWIPLHCELLIAFGAAVA
ncbi:hypothetical protein TNCV_3808391 [Trichonephila clavipes]|nr:hypothetical protein TNCV_3808391 [Trichonephila clavipes]